MRVSSGTEGSRAFRSGGPVRPRYSAAGRILYAVLFVIIFPAVLVWWTVASAHAVPLSTPAHPALGSVVAVMGVGLVAAGMTALITYGQGLPMNAYPPPVFVDRGIYRFTSHPIYVGFVACCAGASILADVSSGLWLVSPMVALALTALVLGYERHDLARRFGTRAGFRPLISLPPASDAPPTAGHRISVYLLVGVPWAIAFESVCSLGVPPDGIDVTLPFERGWPVLEWTQAIYGSAYVFVLATPLVVRTRRALREAAVLGLIATGVVTVIYLVVPAISPPRPFQPQTVLGRALMVERAACHTVAAFPSFHVIWSLIAARAWATRSRFHARAAWIWAALIAVTCVTTGMHAMADIVAAVALYLVLRRLAAVWEVLRRGAERLANSWYEWRWSGIRVLGYGFYAAAAGTIGFWIAGSLAGPALRWPLVSVHVGGVLGAGLWAQRLEGSPALSRPFGYYGSVIGVAIAALAAGLATGMTMRLLAVMAVAAPWVQAVGRLRCLVQGCCHGSPAPAWVGIRYTNPRSRVWAHAKLGGVPLHPTPLYSMLSNLTIGMLLLRLWSVGATYGLIAGTYLLLNGFARFVEESYRGEPQTPIVAGLRLYQWTAIVSALSGMVLTTLRGGHPVDARIVVDAPLVLTGLLVGVLVGVVMGVDVPGSARRFSRLAPP